MLGVGWTEMLVIGVVALIVIGPKELPAVMRRIGQFAGTIRRMGSDFQKELNKTTGLNEIANLRQSITAPLKATTDAIRKEFNTTSTTGAVTPSGLLKPTDPKAESVVAEIKAQAGIAPAATPATAAPVMTPLAAADAKPPVKAAKLPKVAAVTEPRAEPAVVPAAKKPRAPRKPIESPAPVEAMAPARPRTKTVAASKTVAPAPSVKPAKSVAEAKSAATPARRKPAAAKKS